VLGVICREGPGDARGVSVRAGIYGDTRALVSKLEPHSADTLRTATDDEDVVRTPTGCARTTLTGGGGEGVKAPARILGDAWGGIILVPSVGVNVRVDDAGVTIAVDAVITAVIT